MRRMLVVPAVLMIITTSASAQDTVKVAPPSPPVDAVGRKSPVAARFLAIVPSAGHIYAGEVGKGLAFAGGIAGVLLVGGATAGADCLGNALDPNESRPCPSNESIATATSIIALGVWGWSIVDAGHAAQRTNFRRGFTASALLAPSVRRLPDGRDALVIRLGVTLATP